MPALQRLKLPQQRELGIIGGGAQAQNAGAASSAPVRMVRREINGYTPVGPASDREWLACGAAAIYGRRDVLAAHALLIRK